MASGRVIRRKAVRASAWLVSGGFLLLGLAACDLFLPVLAPEGNASLNTVTLYIENRSGLDIAAEAQYLQGEVLVRQTVRQLTALGVESVEEIIPTNADSIVVAARLADGDIVPNGLTAGQTIQTATYRRGIDYSGGEVITFVIAGLPTPNPNPDCVDCQILGDLNNDGVADHNDIPPFIEVVLGRNLDPAARLKCDFNLDGMVNGEDVQGFGNRLLNGK
jgi:hypothetical protein